jgi:tripeptide aminopeptidase
MKSLNLLLLVLSIALVLSYNVPDRFLKYVQLDTQSDPNSRTIPSTQKQKVLATLLVSELLEIGLSDAHMDNNGYVMATLPSNLNNASIPVIGFIAHVDTSPQVSGENVKPIIHKNYQRGQDLIHPITREIIVKASENPKLETVVGHDIVTSDGSTLLGADDKCGCASIIEAMKFLIANPQLKHGTIKVGFTPDEEIGRGADHFNVSKFGAKYAYTIDGSERGEISTESFSADAAVIVFHGISTHPGDAKDKLVNSMKMASHFLNLLPKDSLSPETTTGRQGFVHPNTIVGNEQETKINMIIRDFDNTLLAQHGKLLGNAYKQTLEAFPKGKGIFTIREQYRNMKEMVDRFPELERNAVRGMNNLGIVPIHKPIRGGADGSRLSFMGLPCPNLFNGGHNYHSKNEWASLQDIELSSKLIVELSQLFAK